MHTFTKVTAVNGAADAGKELLWETELITSGTNDIMCTPAVHAPKCGARERGTERKRGGGARERKKGGQRGGQRGTERDSQREGTSHGFQASSRSHTDSTM